ncbi:MAG: hypothetical protein M1833_000023 [Piccolia ochrophora]|nr:MAG: hypothetical protein M1833_000023 [Piccolia ochrophora]
MGCTTPSEPRALCEDLVDNLDEEAVLCKPAAGSAVSPYVGTVELNSQPETDQQHHTNALSDDENDDIVPSASEDGYARRHSVSSHRMKSRQTVVKPMRLKNELSECFSEDIEPVSACSTPVPKEEPTAVSRRPQGSTSVGSSGAKPLVGLRMSDTHAVLKFYYNVLDAIQQLNCRNVAKQWIKTIHPKKQATHPYNSKDGAVPDWWPEDVRHKEPDHIYKIPRLKLLLQILAVRMVPVKDLEASTATMKWAPTPSHSAARLEELYRVAKYEERHFAEHVWEDQDTEIWVNPLYMKKLPFPDDELASIAETRRRCGQNKPVRFDFQEKDPNLRVTFATATSSIGSDDAECIKEEMDMGDDYSTPAAHGDMASRRVTAETPKLAPYRNDLRILESRGDSANMTSVKSEEHSLYSNDIHNSLNDFHAMNTAMSFAPDMYQISPIESSKPKVNLGQAEIGCGLYGPSSRTLSPPQLQSFWQPTEDHSLSTPQTFHAWQGNNEPDCKTLVHMGYPSRAVPPIFPPRGGNVAHVPDAPASPNDETIASMRDMFGIDHAHALDTIDAQHSPVYQQGSFRSVQRGSFAAPARGPFYCDESMLGGSTRQGNMNGMIQAGSWDQ